MHEWDCVRFKMAPKFVMLFIVHRWRGDLGEERRDWVGVEMEDEVNGGGSGSFKVFPWIKCYEVQVK